MKAQVLCRARPGMTLSFALKGEESLVGREPGMAVSVPLDGVSRRHARITWDGKSYWLEDLKSTNGTFLNGQPVMRERLRHLDVITLGKKVDMLFVLKAEATASVKMRGIVRAAVVPEAPDVQPYEIPMGEVTLGRSSVCNIVAESGVVSKVHARIERTLDQLVIQDLGSSNGTFVNGSEVMTSVLRDGDIVSLAGVEAFRVIVEMGEVTSTSGVREAVVSRAPAKAAERPRFSAEWKTRYEWDSGELRALAEIQRLGEERDKIKEAQRGKTKPLGTVKPQGLAPAAAKGMPAAAGKGAAAVPPKPAPPPEAVPSSPKAAAKPAPPAPVAPAARPSAAPVAAAAQPKPASPAPVAPRPEASAQSASRPEASAPSPPRPQVPRPSSPGAEPPIPAAKAAPAPPAKPAAAPPPRPAVPAGSGEVPRVVEAPLPAAPPAGAKAGAPPSPSGGSPAPSIVASPKPVAVAGPINQVRLTGTGVELAASEPGAHDLGRAKEAALRLQNPTVSRRHARIILSDDRTMAYLQDLGGANGTRLNGVAVDRIQPLAEGDVISLGEVELRVSLQRT